MTPKIDDVNATTNQVSSNEPSDENKKLNDKDLEFQELPKNNSSPMVVKMPSVSYSGVQQPLIITSSNSSPLPSTNSLFLPPLLQAPSIIDSSVPKDFSFINTITNVPSSLSDRSVNHTYVSSIKSQVSVCLFCIVFLFKIYKS